MADNMAFREEFDLTASKDNLLGEGAFSKVYRCSRRKDKAAFAVKAIQASKMTAAERAKIQREVQVCQQLKHPNIVEFIGYFPEIDYHYLVFELIKGGELFDDIVERQSYNEQAASLCMYQIFSALQECHKHKIVHRDLKPENLLLAYKGENAPIKLTDFGLAVVAANGPAYFGFAGTPGYLSPEVCRREPYGPPVDLWACGVILYILLVGYPPFWDEKNEVIYDQIKKGDYSFPSPEWDTVTPEAKELIRMLLANDQAQRLTVAQALEHPWIANRKTVASTIHRQNTIEQLKEFNAKKQLKLGMTAVRGASRMMMAARAASSVARTDGEAPPRKAPAIPRSPTSPAGERKHSVSVSVEQHLLSLNAKLIDSIVKGDWKEYTSLCEPNMSCFEPEAEGVLVEGMDFHRFYFKNVSRDQPTNTTIVDPRCRLVGNAAAVITYIRLTQYLDRYGMPKTVRNEETRVWQRKASSWVCVHIHRSSPK